MSRTHIHFTEDVYLHWQNLNEREHGPDGPIVKHGRAWLNLRKGQIHWEWMLGRFECAAYAEIGGGESGRDLLFHIAIPFLISFFLVFESLWPQRLTPGKWEPSTIRPGEKWFNPEQRKIGINFHSGMVWFSLWENSHEWSSRQPWWWQFTFNPLDFFLGSTRHSEETLQETDAEVPMPEGKYPAKVRLFLSTWKRPRWPFAQRIYRAHVDVEGGIPIPGKGENSWDIGDDAVFSITTPAKSVSEAIKAMADSALRTRYRHGGGYDWTPDEPQRWAQAVND